MPVSPAPEFYSGRPPQRNSGCEGTQRLSTTENSQVSPHRIIKVTKKTTRRCAGRRVKNQFREACLTITHAARIWSPGDAAADGPAVWMNLTSRLPQPKL
jgi:hypothetical protein